MKLLVVSNMYPSKEFPSYGVFVRNFVSQLEELNIDYRLAVMHKARGKLQKLGGYVGFYLKSFFCSLFGRYDAVYVHYASHSSPGVLLARKFRKFTVYTNCHGSDVIPQNAGQERMQKNTRAIVGCSEKIIVPSGYFMRVVTEKYAVDPEKVFVCASGGVDTSIFYPARNTQPPFTIGFVSRIEPGKGWKVLLEACEKLSGAYRLLMVGGGSEEEKLRRLVQQMGLTDHVEIAGAQPQQKLPDYLNRMDIFVFPTELKESLGLVAIEAMACGCPVIASDFAAPADYVVDGVNGYKFPVGDSVALTRLLDKMQSMPEQETAVLREGALATARRYTRQQVTYTLEKILLE